jgi:hypothetical protein
MVFWQAVHHTHFYLWVDRGSSCYSFTHSLSYAIIQNSPRCTNQHHTSRKNTACSLFCSLSYTHMETTLFSFWRPLLGMFHFQATYLGYRWIWSPSRYTTCSHILLMGFCNQIMNKNLPEPLVCHFTPHVLWSSKALRMAISVRWKKQLLSPHTPCERYSRVLHEVWLHGQIRHRNCLPLEDYAYLWEHRHHVYPSNLQYFYFLWPTC